MTIESLELKNFKKFDSLELSLEAPITVILGENSSGKSSILKAMLGLKQTTSSSNEYECWAAQGEYTDLGTFQDYIHKRDIKKSFTISLKISLKPRTFLWSITNASLVKICLTYDYESATSQARFLKIEASFLSKEQETCSWTLTRQQTRQNYKLKFSRELIETVEKTYKINLVNDKIFKHLERFSFTNASNKNSRDTNYQNAILNQTLSLLTSYLEKNLFYLAPLRSSPSRSYFRSSHSLAVGVKGEYTPSVLATLENKNRKVTHGHSEHKRKYNSFQKWLSEIFPGHTANTKTSEEIVKLKISNLSTQNYSSSEKSDTITDVGFGFSQVFPIIVQSAVMPENSLLIIEQPELHLHPLAQTRLANVISDAAKQGKRFIIETHSEHFIRGLQLAISENRINKNLGTSKENINFYYIKSERDYIKKLETNEFGEFTTEWPSGFFDESYKTMQKLIMNKLKSE